MAARDVLFIAVILFAMALGFFILNFGMNTMVDSLTSVEEINQTNATLESFKGVTNLLARLDYLILVLLIALTLGMIIGGYFAASHPIFMFVYFIIVVIGVVASTILSNVWETVVASPAFGATIVSFPISNFILTNLPYFIGIVGFIGVIVMFAKPLSSGGFT